MTLKTYLSIATFALISALFSQQDSIILLNGKVYRGTIKSVENGSLYYLGTEKKLENTPIEITTDRVFSFVKTGEETVLYTKDDFKGDFLTVEEARHTTLGSYDARQTFKPRFVFWSSIVVGYGVSLLDTYYTQSSYDNFVKQNGTPPTKAVVGFFGTNPTIMPLVVPLVLSATWGLPSFKIKKDQILQKELFGNEMYYRGFHRIAKQKRIFGAIKGSAIGIGLGMLSYSILRTN